MFSHEFVYPRVSPLPARTTDDRRTPQGPPAHRQRDLVMASLIRCPRPTSRGDGTHA
jgi:hypothetical protein